MNNRRVFTLLFAVALGVGLARAQNAGKTNGPEPIKSGETNSAQWWTSLSDDAKNTFLDGYAAAMTHASNRLFNECAERMKRASTKITSDGRAVPTVPSPGAPVEQVWELCVLGGSFDFAFDRRDLRKGVDDFYKDAQHFQVPIDVALQQVRDVLEGKRPKSTAGIGGPQGKAH